jgi:hypothetical protein
MGQETFRDHTFEAALGSHPKELRAFDIESIREQD